MARLLSTRSLLPLAAVFAISFPVVDGNSIGSSRQGKSQMASRLHDMLGTGDDEFNQLFQSSEEKQEPARRPWKKRVRAEADPWPEINSTTIKNMKLDDLMGDVERAGEDSDSSDPHKIKKQVRMNVKRPQSCSVTTAKLSQTTSLTSGPLDQRGRKRSQTRDRRSAPAAVDMVMFEPQIAQEVKLDSGMSTAVPSGCSSAVRAIANVEDSVKKLLSQFRKKSLRDFSLDSRVMRWNGAVLMGGWGRRRSSSKRCDLTCGDVKVYEEMYDKGWAIV
eukprot:138821-Hanusia_phi.AAC.1